MKFLSFKKVQLAETHCNSLKKIFFGILNALNLLQNYTRAALWICILMSILIAILWNVVRILIFLLILILVLIKATILSLIAVLVLVIALMIIRSSSVIRVETLIWILIVILVLSLSLVLDYLRVGCLDRCSDCRIRFDCNQSSSPGSGWDCRLGCRLFWTPLVHYCTIVHF